MRREYSARDLANLLTNSGVNLTGKKYPQYHLALGALNLIYPDFIQHLIKSVATDHMELQGRPSWARDHVIVVDNRLVRISPYYGHLGDDEEPMHIIESISFNGHDVSVERMVSELESYARSFQNLPDSAEEYLSKQNVKPLV